MKFLLGLFVGVFLSAGAQAVTPVTTSNSVIKSVHIEYSAAFVAITDHVNNTCGIADNHNRVYFDLTNEFHRIGYSTALAAFMAGKKVEIRTEDAPSLFGACRVYDIKVLP